MSGLRRVARQAARATAPGAREERCDLCAAPLTGTGPHRHLLRTTDGSLSCACRACAVLFDHDASARSGYRLLPGYRTRLDGCRVDDAVWAALGVPVDLAFFTRSAESGEVTAAYPSPLGALRSAVPADSWREVERCHAALPGGVSDVTALLVHRCGEAGEHWLLPLDDCYRLVAVVRAHWKGLGGGPEVWQRVEDFFRELTEPLPLTPEEASWASP